MPAGPLPPLRVLLSGDGSYIPVFELELSGGNLTQVSPVRVKYEPPGAAGTSAVVYAPTGAQYVVLASDGTLTGERVLAAGSSVTIVTDSTTVYINALTGGGSSVVYAPSGSSYVVLGLDGTLTAERTLHAGLGLVLADAGVNNTAAIHLLTGGDGTYAISSSGTAEGIAWIDTAGAGGGPVYAPTGAQYVVLAADATLTAERALSIGTGLYAADGGAGNAYVVAASARAIRLPLALATVRPSSANSFWRATTLPLLDEAAVAFVDSGEGVATYWGLVPFNLHPDPNWTLYAYHRAHLGAGGNAIVTFQASAVTHAETAAYTLISSAASLATQVNTAMTVTQVSGGTFDSVVAISNGDYLLVEVNRHGGNTNDTVSAEWDLYALTLQCNVL